MKTSEHGGGAIYALECPEEERRRPVEQSAFPEGLAVGGLRRTSGCPGHTNR